MALEERKIVDRLEVLRDGTVQVREAIEVLRDGEVIATQYHRYVIGIYDDTYETEKLPPEAIAVVEAARTPGRKQAAKQRVAAQAPTEGQGEGDAAREL